MARPTLMLVLSTIPRLALRRGNVAVLEPAQLPGDRRRRLSLRRLVEYCDAGKVRFVAPADAEILLGQRLTGPVLGRMTRNAITFVALGGPEPVEVAR